MAKVSCIANHKGGVGKTTSTAHIAKVLSCLDKHILMIDLDSQANLTSIFVKGVPGLTISDSLVNNTPLAEALPMFGLKMLQQVINDVKDLNPNLAISAVFFNRFYNRKLDHSILEAVSEQYGYIMMNTRENMAAA